MIGTMSARPRKRMARNDVGPRGRGGEFVEWVEGGAVAEAEEFFEAERGEELALELQLADDDPEDDADDADGDC